MIVWKIFTHLSNVHTIGCDVVVYMQEEIIPFFETIKLKETTTNVEEAYLELAEHVRTGLAHVDPYFLKLADGMEAWIACWRQLNPPASA